MFISACPRSSCCGDNWQVFVYRAVEPGEETLHFVEARGWEPDTITNRYDLTIRIRPVSD